MKSTDQKHSVRINRLLDRKVRQAGTEDPLPAKTTIEVVSSSGKVSVDIEDADRLGTLVGRIGARVPAGRPADVTAQAEKAVRRLTYLQEPLAVIESEGRRGRAILRSAEPRPAGGEREYNEAILDGGDSVSIQRFRTQPGANRRAVPSNLSRDTLGRLADDLIDILGKDDPTPNA